MVCNVLACIWKWGSCLFKGFFSVLITYKDISHKCLQFVCLSSTHSWRKLINWCQGAILHHSSFMRFTHAQTAALEMLLFTEQRSYQHKLTREGSRSGKIVSFLVVIAFQLAKRCPFTFQSCGLESWQEEQNSPTSKQLRSTMIPHWTGCEESHGDAIICIFPNSNLKLLLDTVIYLVGRSVVGQCLSNQDGCIL